MACITALRVVGAGIVLTGPPRVRTNGTAASLEGGSDDLAHRQRLLYEDRVSKLNRSERWPTTPRSGNGRKRN